VNQEKREQPERDEVDETKKGADIFDGDTIGIS